MVLPLLIQACLFIISSECLSLVGEVTRLYDKEKECRPEQHRKDITCFKRAKK